MLSMRKTPLLSVSAPRPAILGVEDVYRAIAEFLGDTGPMPTTSEIVPIAATPPVETVSQRELEVLRLLSTGRSNQEIADELVITLGTVKTHVQSIYRKLEVRNRTRAVARGRELNLLS